MSEEGGGVNKAIVLGMDIHDSLEDMFTANYIQQIDFCFTLAQEIPT